MTQGSTRIRLPIGDMSPTSRLLLVLQLYRIDEINLIEVDDGYVVVEPTFTVSKPLKGTSDEVRIHNMICEIVADAALDVTGIRV